MRMTVEIRMIRDTSIFLALLAAAGFARPGLSQTPPAEAVEVLVGVHRDIQSLGSRRPGAIWPGFQPESIPVVYVLPGTGKLILGWTGKLPEGFDELADAAGAGWAPETAPGAASTSIGLEGRTVAQLVVDELEPASLFGTAVHEMFHAFQAGVSRNDRRFGQGENSFLVTRYPVFDPVNEAEIALEGRLLAAALNAEDDARARELAQQFVAVRESRQRSLDAELAEFEIAAELNEGLAQYAGVRALRLLAEEPGVDWRDVARAEARQMLGDLDDLTERRERSFRLRYYRTGAAQALLLDRLAGGGWKARLVESNLSLHDLLAETVGYRERERELRRLAGRAFDSAALAASARRSVAELRESRRARVDSALSRPGVEVMILGEGLGFVGLCGIDPQNLLQVDEGVLLHTRWLVLCAGSALRAEFTTPVVHDQRTSTVRAVVGPIGELRLSADGVPLEPAQLEERLGVEKLELKAPGLQLSAARADLELDGSVLRIRPLRN